MSVAPKFHSHHGEHWPPNLILNEGDPGSLLEQIDQVASTRGVQPRDLFEAHIKLGEIYAGQRKLLRSTAAFKRALAVAEQQIGVIGPEAATALEKLALISQVRGEIQASREVRSTTDWNHVSWGHQVRTYWQGAYRRSPEAAQSQDYRERQQIIETLLQEPSDYPDSVAILYTKARLEQRRNAHSDAADSCRLAYLECLRLLGEAHPRTLDLHAMLLAFIAVACCTRANRFIDNTNLMAFAEQAIAEVQQVKERIGQVDLKELIETQGIIGSCYALHKRSDEAQSFFEEVLTSTLCSLAQCAYYQGRYDEAEQYDLRALAIREKGFGEKLETGQILDHVVQIYEKQGNKQDLIERTKVRVKLIHEVAAKVGSWEYQSYRF